MAREDTQAFATVKCWLSDPEASWWIGAAIVAVPLGITILFSLEMKLFLDDSMIYLTYAKNFSSGLGWTFNPGANDHAATSILHTLSQSLIFLAFFDPQNPDSIFLFLKLFEAAIVTLGVALFYFVLTRSGIAPIFAGFAVAFFISARFVVVYHLFSGMETSLYLVFLCLAMLLYERSRLASLGFVTGILFLVRPEALVVGPILALLDFAFVGVGETRNWLRKWIIPGSIAAAITLGIGAIFYFTKGSMIPESAEVKLLSAKNWGSYQSRIPAILTEFRHCVPLAFLGLFALKRKRSALNGLLVSSLVLVFLYIVLGMPKAPWYYLPFCLGFFSLVAVGLQKVGDLIRGHALPIWPAYAGLALMMLVVDGTGFPQVWRNRGALR